MADRTTFFMIDRSIFDSWVWNIKPFNYFQAWIYIIGYANYADRQKLYKGVVQNVKRGQLVTSQEKLAEDWGWSRGKVRRFLNLLENDGMIHVNSTTGGTTLTVENYEKFQSLRPARRTTDGTALGTTDGTTDGTHNNKGNKYKREEGGTHPRSTSAPVKDAFQLLAELEFDDE